VDGVEIFCVRLHVSGRSSDVSTDSEWTCVGTGTAGGSCGASAIARTACRHWQVSDCDQLDSTHDTVTYYCSWVVEIPGRMIRPDLSRLLTTS